MNFERNISRKTVAILLLVIVVLGSVSVYDTLLLQGVQPRTLDVTSQVYANPVVVQSSDQTLNPIQIYAMENSSVVTVSGDAYTVTQTYYGPMNVSGQVLGTGWVVLYSNSYYVITNFHVIDGMSNDTVTFSNGDAYQAKVVGSDPVEIEGDQIRLVGKGMQVDMEARTFKVLSDVRTRWKWGKRG